MSPILARIINDIDRIKKLDQWRVLCPPKGIDFCSNDYLSLSRHHDIIASVKQSVERHGYGSSSSRFIRGECPKYQTLQENLAQFKQTKKTLLFPSGYAANIGVLTSVIRKGDIVFSDRLNHASLIDGLRLTGAHIHVFPHCDIQYLSIKIAEVPMSTPKFLVTESLFSMDGDIAPLDHYAELSQKYGMALIVDEAHAVGIFGRHGAGLINQFGIEDAMFASVNGLGKAFGCYGAFVAADEMVIDYLLQKARTLMFSTGLPPLALDAIAAALTLIQSGDKLRTRLFENIAFIRNEIESASIKTQNDIASPILPIIVHDNHRAKHIAEQLLQVGFDVKAIRPPTVPENSARLRITTNVSHTKELLSTFVIHLQALL